MHTLSVAGVGRLRGVLEQVAANRPAVDIHGFNERNTDLQQEWHRLDRGGWDARKIDLALPRPKSVRSDTGWLLSQFRDLPSDPEEEPRVVEAQMLLLAWMMKEGTGEWGNHGISREESDRLFDLAHDLGYLDDHYWTEDGARLCRLVEDWTSLSEMGDDPRGGLVRQAMETESMQT